MDIVSTISHGRGATLGARQLWARMSGTMRRLRRTMHALLYQVRPGQPAGRLGNHHAASQQPLPHSRRCRSRLPVDRP